MSVDKNNGGLTIICCDSGKLFEAYAHNWINLNFEILSEEDEEIDIDSIEELEHIYIYGLPENIEKVDDRVSKTVEKVNELIKAVKQLNNKIKE